jgi:hypothetical protein
MVREHWRRHRPRTYAGLQAMGQLESSIETAVQLTLTALTRLVYQGMAPWEAWQAVREEWALPPEEAEDQHPGAAGAAGT